MALEIKTICVTPFFQNARVLIDTDRQAAAIVDPGGDVGQILGALPTNVRVESIILTHAHIDHAGGVAEMFEHLKKSGQKPKLYGHRSEKEMRENIALQARMFGLDPAEYPNCPEPDVYLSEPDEISVGGIQGKVLFTPGHSPGHLSFHFPKTQTGLPEDIVIAGDALFGGAIGRTDLPGGDYDTLIRSIREKLLTLPSNTVVMPGHGPDTSVEVERDTNPFLIS